MNFYMEFMEGESLGNMNRSEQLFKHYVSHQNMENEIQFDKIIKKRLIIQNKK